MGFTAQAGERKSGGYQALSVIYPQDRCTVPVKMELNQFSKDVPHTELDHFANEQKKLKYSWEDKRNCVCK